MNEQGFTEICPRWALGGKGAQLGGIWLSGSTVVEHEQHAHRLACAKYPFNNAFPISYHSEAPSDVAGGHSTCREGLEERSEVRNGAGRHRAQ